MPEIAQDIPNKCPRYAQDMPEICSQYAQDMSKVCQRYAQYMPKNMLKTCPRYDKISKTLITDSLSNMYPRDASASKKLMHKIF